MKTFTINPNGKQMGDNHFASSQKIKSFTITKKIAKQGKQAVIIIPKLLQEELKPDTIVKLTIDVIREGN